MDSDAVTPKRPSNIVRRALRLDLQTLDTVITLRQAERHYGLTSTQLLDHFPHRQARCAPLNTSSIQVQTTFLTNPERESWLFWQPAWELAHRAGTAELRHHLGAQRIPSAIHPQAWTPEGGYGQQRPDAEWQTPDGRRIAVEYDAGYSRTVVREKLQAFQAYDEVIWGTASAIRHSHLQSRYPGRAQFLTLDFL